jgi:hypothetical protein
MMESYIDSIKENFNSDLVGVTYNDFLIMSSDYLIKQEMNKLLYEL